MSRGNLIYSALKSVDVAFHQLSRAGEQANWNLQHTWRTSTASRRLKKSSADDRSLYDGIYVV